MFQRALSAFLGAKPGNMFLPIFPRLCSLKGKTPKVNLSIRALNGFQHFKDTFRVFTEVIKI